MTFLRAVLFNSLFYALLVAVMLVSIPLLFLPRAATTKGLKMLLGVLNALQALFGLKIHVEGREHLPQGGCLIASKHQSMWETFYLPLLVDDPAFIYKVQLARIPLFGHFMRKMDMVPIDRAKGASALRDMVREAKTRMAQGRQIILFPEGTRRPAGAPPDYKTGIALLYQALDVSVSPVAHNSGRFWSNYFWTGRQGTLTLCIMPALPPALPRGEFMQKLENEIETASTALNSKA